MSTSEPHPQAGVVGFQLSALRAYGTEAGTIEGVGFLAAGGGTGHRSARTHFGEVLCRVSVYYSANDLRGWPSGPTACLETAANHLRVVPLGDTWIARLSHQLRGPSRKQAGQACPLHGCGAGR
jgi:hypothetical protein